MSHRPYFNPLTNPMGSPGEHRNAYPRTPQAMASQSAPEALPDPPHRDINADPSREISARQFNVQSPSGGIGVYSDEITVLSLVRPHSAVDVYLSLTSVGGLVTVSQYMEVVITIYAVVGSSRAAVARGAYATNNSNLTQTFDRNALMAAARVGAERYDVTIRVCTGTAAAAFVGTISAIGYDSPGFDNARPRTARSVLVGATLKQSFSIQRRAQLVGVNVFNSGAAVGFIVFFDRTAFTLLGDGRVGTLTYAIPAGSSLVVDLSDRPLDFYDGIYWQSSGSFGASLAAGAQNLAVQYDYV